MAWTRLTDRESDYAANVLGNRDEEKPAILDRNVITFVGAVGKKDFLLALRDQIASDRACKAKTVGPHLLAKPEKL